MKQSWYDETVGPKDACPECGEVRTDWLTWDKQGETVTCASCQRAYRPRLEEQ